MLEVDEGKKLLKQCSRPTPSFDGIWVPKAEQIVELESRFEKCLRHAALKPISNYQRQYIGIVRKGIRSIYMSAVQEDSGAPVSKSANVLCDGASRAFGVEYHLVDGLFDSFQFNSGLAGAVAGKVEYRCEPAFDNPKIELTEIPLKSLKSVIPVVANSKEFYCANYSKDRWQVSVSKKGKVEAHLVKRKGWETLRSLRLGDATLLARDSGEWGGSLKVLSKDGISQIYDGNISHLFQRSPTSVIALGGLAHLGSDEGVALELEHVDGAWKLARREKLSSEPRVAISDAHRIVMVMSGQVSELDFRTLKERSIASVTNRGLGIESVAIDRTKTIYVGMTYAVAVLEKSASGYSERWLARRKCVGHEDLESIYE